MNNSEPYKKFGLIRLPTTEDFTQECPITEELSQGQELIGQEIETLINQRQSQQGSVRTSNASQNNYVLITPQRQSMALKESQSSTSSLPGNQSYLNPLPGQQPAGRNKVIQNQVVEVQRDPNILNSLRGTHGTIVRNNMDYRERIIPREEYNPPNQAQIRTTAGKTSQNTISGLSAYSYLHQNIVQQDEDFFENSNENNLNRRFRQRRRI